MKRLPGPTDLENGVKGKYLDGPDFFKKVGKRATIPLLKTMEVPYASEKLFFRIGVGAGVDARFRCKPDLRG
jgi:hypothetical protein